jgi:DNA-3-methyladenine glycosylase
MSVRATGEPGRLPLRPVSHAFFARPSLLVARDLLGCILVRDSAEGRTTGMIVETEAYGMDDPGSHAFRGRTQRNAPMFEGPGRAYVYFSYGMHWMLNAVTDRDGHPGAVLIRAAEPLDGIELMRARRASSAKAPRRLADRDLARGPGRLAQAFAIGADMNRVDLTRPPLYVCMGERFPEEAVGSGPRIGLGAAQDGRTWRFWVRGNPNVSGPGEKG